MSDYAYTEQGDPEYIRRLDDEAREREWADEQRQDFGDPKPHRRYRASKDEWINYHEWRSEQPCRICGGRSTNTHHIYPRGQGGDDLIENFAPLCGSGTTGCHGLVEAHDPIARAKLRDSLTLENRLYLTRKLGHRAAAWLDWQYPELAA